MGHDHASSQLITSVSSTLWQLSILSAVLSSHSPPVFAITFLHIEYFPLSPYASSSSSHNCSPLLLRVEWFILPSTPFSVYNIPSCHATNKFFWWWKCFGSLGIWVRKPQEWEKRVQFCIKRSNVNPNDKLCSHCCCWWRSWIGLPVSSLNRPMNYWLNECTVSSSLRSCQAETSQHTVCHPRVGPNKAEMESVMDATKILINA